MKALTAFFTLNALVARLVTDCFCGAGAIDPVFCREPIVVLDMDPNRCPIVVLDIDPTLSARPSCAFSADFLFPTIVDLKKTFGIAGQSDECLITRVKEYQPENSP